MPSPPTTTAGPFPKGVNNRLADNAMTSVDQQMGGVWRETTDKLRHAVNVTLNDAGKLALRKGFSLTAADAGAHSGFDSMNGVLYVAKGVLKLYDTQGGTTTTIQSGMSDAPMAYVDVNNDVYYSNGLNKGKVVNGLYQEWGIAPPVNNPVLTAVAGALPAGIYQVLLSYETASGEESGTGLSPAISLGAGQGISITGIPVPPANVVRVNVMITTHNGDTPYLVAQLTPGTTAFQFLTASYSGRQEKTQFYVPPPPGNVLAYSCGRIYTAYKKVICYTDPLMYGLYHPVENYFLMPDDVQIMCGVIDGLYIVTSEKTYFMSGGDPREFSQKPALPYGGAFGSAAKSLPESDTWFWYSDRGLVKATSGGSIKAIQEDNLLLDPAISGSTLWMEQNGIQQVVSLSTPKGYSSSAAAQGFVDMEVRRKGL